MRPDRFDDLDLDDLDLDEDDAGAREAWERALADAQDAVDADVTNQPSEGGTPA